jgi:hypothetical protein
MHCDPDVKEHLHQAKQQIHHAVEAASERLISDDVRGHLRDSARHLLRAGLAALDADQEYRAHRAAQRAAHRAAQPPVPAQPPETPMAS